MRRGVGYVGREGYGLLLLLLRGASHLHGEFIYLFLN